MTEAGWTREKPREAGWYWWRDVDKHGKVRFCVCQEVYLLHGSLFAADCGYLDKLDGEWLGPITPDMCIAAQSAHAQGRREGLREAADRHHQHRCGLVHDMTFAEWIQQQIDQAQGGVEDE